jgi:uncharacterized protein YutE (UPF0331/DUF86 family)
MRGCAEWLNGDSTMVNRDVIAAKLADLESRCRRVRLHSRSSAAAFAADPDALDLVAFNLMLAVQICADIASHVIADEGWPGARTLAEAFERLHAHGLLSGGTKVALARAAGLRNVIAHGYANVDVNLVYAAATQGLGDLDAFAREIAAWVAKQP